MRLKEFLELYNNWNHRVVIKDNELNTIVKAVPSYILSRCDLGGKEVVAFVFYDGELGIRVK